MTNSTIGSLRMLQALDDRIREIRGHMATFDERLAAVEEPALRLEQELAALRERLQQMRADERRLERAANDKRARTEKMEARLTKVSNLREEAAVKTELDLIVKAIAADEQEALQLIDQIRRTEAAEEELAKRTEEARAAVEPAQAELLRDRAALLARRDEFATRRTEVLKGIASQERRVYEAFYQSGRTVVVATLQEDGACGHCFGVVPLQIQNEIRRGGSLIQCEGCGVMLTAEPEPDLDPSVAEPITLSFEDEAPAEGTEGDQAAPEAEGE